MERVVVEVVRRPRSRSERPVANTAGGRGSGRPSVGLVVEDHPVDREDLRVLTLHTPWVTTTRDSPVPCRSLSGSRRVEMSRPRVRGPRDFTVFILHFH